MAPACSPRIDVRYPGLMVRQEEVEPGPRDNWRQRRHRPTNRRRNRRVGLAKSYHRAITGTKLTNNGDVVVATRCVHISSPPSPFPRPRPQLVHPPAFQPPLVCRASSAVSSPRNSAKAAPNPLPLDPGLEIVLILILRCAELIQFVPIPHPLRGRASPSTACCPWPRLAAGEGDLSHDVEHADGLCQGLVLGPLDTGGVPGLGVEDVARLEDRRHHLRIGRIERLPAQQSDRLELVGRLPAQAAVQQGAQLAPAVEQPSAAGGVGFELEEAGVTERRGRRRGPGAESAGPAVEVVEGMGVERQTAPVVPEERAGPGRRPRPPRREPPSARRGAEDGRPGGPPSARSAPLELPGEGEPTARPGSCSTSISGAGARSARRRGGVLEGTRHPRRAGPASGVGPCLTRFELRADPCPRGSWARCSLRALRRLASARFDEVVVVAVVMVVSAPGAGAARRILATG